MKKNLFIPLLCMLSSLILVSCVSQTPEPVAFTIEMSEYAYAPENIEVKVGQQVTLNLVNKGQLAHEIMFGREVMMMDGHPNGYQHELFDEAGVEPMMTGRMEDHGHDSMDHEGFMVQLSGAGEETSMTFTVTKEMLGEWEMGCFELDGVHYTQGMTGKFIVSR